MTMTTSIFVIVTLCAILVSAVAYLTSINMRLAQKDKREIQGYDQLIGAITNTSLSELIAVDDNVEVMILINGRYAACKSFTAQERGDNITLTAHKGLIASTPDAPSYKKVRL